MCTHLEAMLPGIVAGRALVRSPRPRGPRREELPLLLGHDHAVAAVVRGGGALARGGEVDGGRGRRAGGGVHGGAVVLEGVAALG